MKNTDESNKSFLIQILCCLEDPSTLSDFLTFLLDFPPRTFCFYSRSILNHKHVIHYLSYAVTKPPWVVLKAHKLNFFIYSFY